VVSGFLNLFLFDYSFLFTRKLLSQFVSLPVHGIHVYDVWQWRAADHLKYDHNFICWLFGRPNTAQAARVSVPRAKRLWISHHSIVINCLNHDQSVCVRCLPLLCSWPRSIRRNCRLYETCISTYVYTLHKHFLHDDSKPITGGFSTFILAAECKRDFRSISIVINTRRINTGGWTVKMINETPHILYTHML